LSSSSWADYYSVGDLAPQQGDILLAHVARVVDDDDFAPPRWKVLDEGGSELLPAAALDSGEVLPALRVVGGRCLVMVTTRDCGLDKDFNSVVDQLVKQGGLTEQEAMRRAEARTDLDRTFQVSPLLDPADVEIAGNVVDQGLLLSGRYVEYLPVPELVVAGQVLVPSAVVDLNYRTTIDRLSYTRRLSCVSEATRERLRYALARLDVLRTPTLESQLSTVLGQVITKAGVHKKNPLLVQLTLQDKSVIELLRKPGSPAPGPVGRSRRSVR
jgi:hypothetical protein